MKILKALPLVLFALAVISCASTVETAAEAPAEMSAAMNTSIADIVAAGKATPVDGITSTGQPTEEALKVFADSGYVAVIDLRTAEEERGIDEPAAVEAAGMSYISLPVAGADGVTFENSARLDEYLARFAGPVVVHCGGGNRVGALLALRQHLKGDDAETSVAYGKEGGLTRLEPKVREALGADKD
jgi:uncharacterized protein (TIGR01244 family)